LVSSSFDFVAKPKKSIARIMSYQYLICIYIYDICVRTTEMDVAVVVKGKGKGIKLHHKLWRETEE
jgi:hypothetical protein